MDILLNDKESYLGDFINNHCAVYIDIFNKCSITDKLLLIFIRLIDIIAIIITLLGFMFPKNLLLWHIVVCFIILCYSINDDSSTNFTFAILKRNNNVGYTNERLLIASKCIPIKNNSITIIKCS